MDQSSVLFRFSNFELRVSASFAAGQKPCKIYELQMGDIDRVSQGARILVVEDEANERQGLAELLTAWGYETETAGDGAEALDKIAAFNPAVVISDLRMPRMGGMDLLKRLHDDGVKPWFILLTGQGTIEEAVEATKLGAFNFLEKPVDSKRLQVELRNCLERNEDRQNLEIAQRRLRAMGVLGQPRGPLRRKCRK